MSDTERADMQNVGELDRVVSALGGAVLLAYAAARPSALHTFFAIGGVLLVERALTGRSNVYRTLGIDTCDHGEAKPRVTRGLGKRGEYSIVDEIERASDHSFPASDPPSWTPHRVGSPTGAE